MLQLTDISKQYKTGELVQNALSEVSFSLRDNEFVSILGPSGSGKTTLLNIIGGLDRYDSGDLIINGTSTKQYKNKDWDTYRNHTIGFVFQSYNLISHQSILANVELALTIGGISVRERRKRARQALEEVGLADQIHKRPNQLSGGQMQRVAIARALVNDPHILLADEPTGALDSATSLQIMELLKKVAQDRLVVMVTHNAELAQEYSTRIIHLKDGRIISDTDPFDPSVPEERESKSVPPQEEAAIPAPAKDSEPLKKKRARMSFWTALSLSANNLRSKKGRTVLISLASSIGIIGIALILSISTGVNDYIYKIQKDAMTSYPIIINSQTLDLNGLMSNEGLSFQGGSFDLFFEEPADDDAIHSDFSAMESREAFTTNLVKNNLTGFKKYLDDPSSDIQKYLGENGVVYTYNVAFDVYTRDSHGLIQNTDASADDIVRTNDAFSIMSSNMKLMRSTGMFGFMQESSGASNFSQMEQGTNGQLISQVVLDNYEVLAGRWPESYDEVVLVLDRSNSLSAETMYQLGLMDGNTYQEIAAAIQNGEQAPDVSWSFEDALGRSYYLVTASDHYQENEDGTFRYLDDSYLGQDDLMQNAMELKVSGIIRPAEDAAAADIRTAVGYLSGLTDYCITHTLESPVIMAQQASPATNVLTGMDFEPADDAQKARDAAAYIHNMSGAEKAQLYALISYYTKQTDEGSEEATEEMGQDGMLSSDSSLEDMMKMFGLSDNPVLSGIMQMLGEDTLNSIFANISFLASDESQQAAMLDQWLEEDPDQDILVSLYDQYGMGGSYDENMDAFGMVSYDAPASISIYTDTFANKDGVTACIDAYNAAENDSDNRIVYTDYISLLTSSLTQIVNAISYVLVAFVAVSLLVSCIMIGIITHISVLERTREIGILRAIGASRGNISQVFNAETVIIGLISGLMGVLISMILTAPINLILKLLVGSDMITVRLAPLYALLLVAISVVVTVIGGIIPAARASRKDPVIALRSE